MERLQVAVELLSILCPVEDERDTKPGPDPPVVQQPAHAVEGGIILARPGDPDYTRNDKTKTLRPRNKSIWLQ